VTLVILVRIVADGPFDDECERGLTGRIGAGDRDRAADCWTQLASGDGHAGEAIDLARSGITPY